MKKSKFFLASCFLLLASIFSACESHFAPTPPIATPSESLPLYESPVSDATETGDEGSSTDYASSIKAIPTTIYVAGSGKTEKSVVTVSSGTFKTGTTVTVYGKTENPDDVKDPPSILAEDKDSSKKDIQLSVNSYGGLSFTVQAGTTPGIYEVYASGTPYYTKSMQSVGKTDAAAGGALGAGMAAADADGMSTADLIYTLLSVTITILE